MVWPITASIADRRSSSQFLLDLTVDTALLAGQEDPARVLDVVTAISFVDIDPLDLAARQSFGFLDDLVQRMPVIGVPMERLGVKNELTALAASVRGRDRYLASELIGLVRLSFPDALRLRCVPGIELPTALTLLLAADLARLQQGHGEDGEQAFVIADLAGDVTDQATQPCAQEFQFPGVAFELFGMGIAPGHHCRRLCRPDIGLPEINAMVLGQLAKLFDCGEQKLCFPRPAGLCQAKAERGSGRSRPWAAPWCRP